MVGKKSSDLPPGFRFHPTDEELIMYYLRNQATARPCPVSIIPEVDIYKFDPWELPEKAEFGENEWYFFTPRDRKYPNGARPNRASVSGYWKATGTDKAIYSGSKLSDSISQTNKQSGSMRLDDWVLCRIYKKKSTIGRVLDPKVEDLGAQIVTTNDASDSQMLKIPRICSLSHLWKLDCLGSLPQLLNENSYHPNFDYQTTMGNAGNFSGGIENFKFGDQFPYQYMDSVKFEASHRSNAVNQPIFVNPAFQFQ
ncbi:NAC-like, activated by AP3/PI [Actinidia rufa]|uniref:NAC-like, activated by AP3/PI n=1 Tax=Actinidia rufa TaxID=165716 RepID=A0A7J0DSG3_9ERIC|nr:NAC-like, activated by AP3/PI [Actinidia rufa]